MLTILPEKNEELLKKYDELQVESIALVCREDGGMKGYIVFIQNGYIIEILDFVLTNGIQEIKGEAYILCDSMLRSLGSYAINHSCFYIECSNKELLPILKKFSFEENDNKLTINLQQLLKVCKI